MAKAIKVKVKMESTAGTGTFFVAEKKSENPSGKAVHEKIRQEVEKTRRIR